MQIERKFILALTELNGSTLGAVCFLTVAARCASDRSTLVLINGVARHIPYPCMYWIEKPMRSSQIPSVYYNH